MSTSLTKRSTQKITISLPQDLAERFKAQIPVRQRSEFIAQILEEYFALDEQVKAIDETAGCWTDQNHPEMANDEDIETWLTNLRSSWRVSSNG